MKEYGCYIIKDDFFADFNDSYLKGNKEENRPHYCCFKDYQYPDLFWMIPMSHQITKYEALIEKRKQQNKPCDIVHVITINGNKSVVLIQDMFPIIDKYIERPYTINSIPLVIKNPQVIKELDKKCKNIYRLIHKHVSLNPTQPDVLSIKQKLIEKITHKDIVCV